MIQLSLILVLTQILAVPFTKIRQPRVISEIVAGIILGPTALGRIPGFTAHIFPPQSMSYLKLLASIGIVLFVFLVGLEVSLLVIFQVYYRSIRSTNSPHS